MGVRGRQAARTCSSGFYFILIVFLFWGRLKGKQQFPIGPKRVRKRSVFFLLIPNMYLLPPSNFLSSKSFFLLPGRVGFPLLPLFLLQMLIPAMVASSRIKSSFLVIYISSALNIVSLGDTAGAAVS